jgi:hypothetical protein
MIVYEIPQTEIINCASIRYSTNYGTAIIIRTATIVVMGIGRNFINDHRLHMNN